MWICQQAFNSINIITAFYYETKSRWGWPHLRSPGLTATCPKDLKWFALMLCCLMLYQHGVWSVTKQAKLSSQSFLKTGSFQCGAMDIKRLYEKNVLHKIIWKY